MSVAYLINQMTPTVPQVGGGTGGGNPQTTFTLVSYCDGLIFENNTLKQIPIEGGYVTFNGTMPQYHFYIQDHQGNNRLVCDESGIIEQVNHYYPYGGLMGESEDITSTQSYKYNGKELDRMHGLNLYDYHARQYDAAICQFTTMDPLCEKYYHISPYAYCMGNPVNYVDPDGREPTRREAARIAAHVYGDQEDEILIGGWRVSAEDFKIRNTDGLKSQVYERVDKNGKVVEYVYATAGTGKKDIKDWVADVTQVIGCSKQYDVSAENAQRISRIIKDKGMELNYVGHSLGGGEAALNSLLTFGKGKGRKAFTFNAAGVSFVTKIKAGGIMLFFKSERSIIAYITITDPLNIVQNNRNILPCINGSVKYVLPNRINGHSITNFIDK